jgi:hypothetical protein
MANGFNWQVQVGPMSTPAEGVVNGNSATFYAASSGTTGQLDAAYSTDAGNSWTPIPPEQEVSASGDNAVQWRFNPGGDEIKFLIGNVA